MRYDFLQEAFQKLNEETFDADIDGIKELSTFRDESDKAIDTEVSVIDDEAESEEDLKSSYLGKVIVECPICHSYLFKNKDAIDVVDGEELCNQEDECPYCCEVGGFSIIGVVAPYGEAAEEDEAEDEEEDEIEDEVESDEDEEESEDEAEVKEEDEEEDKEEVEESLDEKCTGDNCDESNEKLIECVLNKYLGEDAWTSFDYESDDVHAPIKAYKDDSIVGNYQITDNDELYDLDENCLKEACCKEACKGEDCKEACEDGECVNEDFLTFFAYTLSKIATELGCSKDDLIAWIQKNPGKINAQMSIDEIRDIYNACKDGKCENICEEIEVSPEGKMLKRWTEKTYNDPAEKENRDSMKVWDVLYVIDGEIHYDGGFTREEAEAHKNELLTDTSITDALICPTVSFSAGIFDPKEWGIDESLEEDVISATIDTDRGQVTVDDDATKLETEVGTVTSSGSEITITPEDNTDEDAAEEPAEEPAEEVVAPADELKDEEEPSEEEVPAEEPAEEESSAEEEPAEEVEVEEENPEEEEEVEADVSEIEEESFNALGTKFLNKVYENVESFTTTDASTVGNKLQLEGVIKFKSGKETKTSFVFEAKDMTANGRARFVGENKTFATGKKPFTMIGSLKDGNYIAESLSYNFSAKTPRGVTAKVSGTVSNKK